MGRGEKEEREKEGTETCRKRIRKRENTYRKSCNPVERMFFGVGQSSMISYPPWG